MNSQEITVTAKWTAQPGMLDELKAIWQAVAAQVEANEPGLLRLDAYDVDDTEAVIIHEVFADAVALGGHLGGTAAQFFPKLMEIATPGPYFFCGDVPDEIMQVAYGMNMGAVFGTREFGFSRSPAEAS